ncbi:MAG: alpha/beta fold hydrolase [Acidobacteria bacterium]|nr:alpha/beta fold hydrolase [Acidobacteriota bacterium]
MYAVCVQGLRAPWRALLPIAFLAAVSPRAAEQVAAPSTSFSVFLQGRVIGSEQVTVSADAGGHVIGGTSRIAPPFDLALKRVQIRYGADWAPLDAEIEGTIRSQPLSIRTSFAGGTATSQITQGDQAVTDADPVAADTIVLPKAFFGSYEALAARLAGVQPGSSLRAYVLPQVEIAIRIIGAADERVQLPDRTIPVKRYDLVFENPGAPVSGALYADQGGRLLRLQIPSQGVEVVRSDIASVAARRETISHPGDEQLRIPANGFTLAATVTKPSTRARWPAVVLVAGSGPMDRDETVAGIPILGQIAGGLADAGFLTVRYDKRGIGQSGGRAEAATLLDYAEDARAVVKYLANRKDIDRDRIAIVGHSEGGWVGMLAAANERKRVAALVLLATPGSTGAELVLEQQRHTLDRMKTPDAERQEKIELQRRIHQAVTSGRGWEQVPEPLRRQADTPWFQSMLTFDPARVMQNVRQPVFILNGALDRQVPPEHAERLTTLARQRKKVIEPPASTMLPGLNHLFIKAVTGEVDEYATLPDRSVSPEALSAVQGWLKTALAPRRSR